MAKGSEEYWREREETQRQHNIHDEKQYNAEIRKIYQRMEDEIRKEINGFYGKYAAKEGITIEEARRRVSKLDMEEYSRKAKEYVANRDLSPQANEEMRLYNLTMKVNRLEMLKATIGVDMVGGFDDLEKLMGQKLTEKALSEMERQAGILGRTVQNNEEMAHAIVNASFHNAKFSDRIWMYQDMLKGELDQLLSTGLIQGKHPTELARHLHKFFGVSRYDAERLMRTEMARVQTEAQKQSLLANGFQEYEFITVGYAACPICAALDGKHFKLKEMQPGRNAPPMHPNCRCSTAAWMDREKLKNELFREDVSYRARSIKNINDLQKISNSPVVAMDSIDEIVLYFDSKYGIEIQDFGDQDIFRIKATLSGYDDFFSEFPKAGRFVKNIMFSPQFEDDGKMSSNGFSVVGPSGLAYGTGLHEAAHALDYAKSSPELHTFSNAVLIQAIREAGYKTFQENIHKIIGSLFLTKAQIANILADPSELFAYSLETALAGGNAFADILLEVTKRYYAEFV